ncbi:MAG TPA: hypothetical protein VMF89_31100, partial [Polyangiales bacterium]|nr:hypothetical protein [Polyangiales bacterium]
MTAVRAGCLLALLAPACTVLLDAQKKQCETDQDCWDRGLDGAVCVREVCERDAAGSDTEQGVSGIDMSTAPEPGTSSEMAPPTGGRAAPSGGETLPPDRTATQAAGTGMQPSAAGR